MLKKSDIIKKIKPLADRVLVRPEPVADKVGEILLSEEAKEKPSRGVVVAAGPGLLDMGKLVRLDVKKGDRILYAKFSGMEIDVAGEKLLVMRQDDILGIIK